MTKNFPTIKFIIVLIVLSAYVAGCSTVNPYTGEKQTAKATTGSAIGALAGAILGAATASKEDRKKRALQGAGIGAIAGGGVGYYMDVQEAKLRQELQGSGVQVKREGDNIVLDMPSNITFDTDQHQLKPQFHATLNSVVKVLNEYESTLITVMGHTDSTGSTGHNQQLSERRAYSVANFLLNQGVAKERLAAIGYGEARPIASNDTSAGRAKNRRVELALEPIGK